MRRSASGAGAGASDVDDASAVTVTPAPDAPGVEAQVRVTCPDKTGLAADIARTLLHEFPTVEDVRVGVRKPHVAVSGVVDSLGVEIYRKRGEQF